jgi:hypothetical protein
LVFPASGRAAAEACEGGRIVEINVRYHPIFSTQLEKQLTERFVSRALIALTTPMRGAASSGGLAGLKLSQ